jgi:hypothetical protein
MIDSIESQTNPSVGKNPVFKKEMSHLETLPLEDLEKQLGTSSPLIFPASPCHWKSP